MNVYKVQHEYTSRVGYAEYNIENCEKSINYTASIVYQCQISRSVWVKIKIKRFVYYYYEGNIDSKYGKIIYYC